MEGHGLPGSPGSECRVSEFSSELHTWNPSLVLSHSRNHLRGASLSALKRGPPGLTQRAGPLGPGRSHWAGPQGSGRRAVLGVSPMMPSLSTGGLPCGAPEHLPGSFIYPVSTLPASRGTEFIFHNSSTREGGISPLSKCGH